MNKTLRIAIACLVGGILGATLALHFNAYLWWAGILLGGLAGYLICDIKQVAQAVQKAWKLIVVTELHLPKRDKIIEDLKHFGILFLGVMVMVLVLVLIGASWVLPISMVGVSGFASFKSLFIASIIVGCIAVFCGCATAEKILGYDDNEGRFFRFVLISTNSFAIFFYLVPMGLIRLGRRIPDRILSRFVAKVFVLIHSDFRLLCMTDAALGALIGYTVASPLVGGIAGAILGVANYWLVSVRWLKLVRA